MLMHEELHCLKTLKVIDCKIGQKNQQNEDYFSNITPLSIVVMSRLLNVSDSLDGDQPLLTPKPIA